MGAMSSEILHFLKVKLPLQNDQRWLPVLTWFSKFYVNLLFVFIRISVKQPLIIAPKIAFIKSFNFTCSFALVFSLIYC